MSILFVLIPLSLVLVFFAGWAFFWAVDKGQFDDLDIQAWSVLQDDSTQCVRGEPVEPTVRGEPGTSSVRGEPVTSSVLAGPVTSSVRAEPVEALFVQVHD